MTGRVDGEVRQNAGIEAKNHFTHANTVPELTMALRSAGVDLHALVQDLLHGGAAGALIVGSVAEGMACGVSDLDILLLFDAPARDDRDSRQDPRNSGTSYDAVTSISRDELIRRGGIEVNVERLEWATFTSAPGISRWIGQATARPGRAHQSVVLLNAELKLLHRIASGWPLLGETVVQSWRDRLNLDMLPTYLAVSRFLLAMESLEDAVGSADELPEMAVYLGRGVVEDLLICRTGLGGGTNPSRRYFLRRMGRLAGGEIAGDHQLLFPAIPADSEAARRYLRKVYAFSRRIRSEFDLQPVPAIAIGMTEAKLRYRLPAWLDA